MIPPIGARGAEERRRDEGNGSSESDTFSCCWRFKFEMIFLFEVVEIESRQGFRGGLGREADREKWPSYSFSASFSLSCQLSSSSSFSFSSPSSCLPSSSSSPCWSGGSPELAPGKALCRLPRAARRRSWRRCSLH